ncbi:hypothetical protein EDC14_105010 [Hydrogenispora ethanolica]|uniref:Regulator of cell morphogenesis and NO signaling n=1 Tax=Hydrogenispora ethanolica TaxID=1082276 RepID=A0A4R1QRG1_HYDET|nr:DUF438 domain-containing protein [Hydrogenispora ethanolica]TCL56456.1 hypothetical protein EDC14_105010 [Hydrogenispora ethanolica]
MNVHELAKTLQEINEGTIPASKAKEILASVNPLDLSLAEQKLIEEGTKPDELRKLCDVHLELIQMEAEELKKKLTPGHPLHTLFGEHDIILGFLDKLEEVSKRVTEKAHITEDDPDVKLLRDVAKSLVEAEKHHAREEDALFPALENQGITGPTRIMRMEHDELRAKKKELYALVHETKPLTNPESKAQLLDLASFITRVLKEHIIKENSILYPSAFQELKRQEIWEMIKQKSDQIGYCSFTPKH